MIIEKVNKKSQNSLFDLASVKLQFLPLFVMNLSVSLGVVRILLIDSLLINDSEMIGTKRLKERITNKSLEPQ